MFDLPQFIFLPLPPVGTSWSFSDLFKSGFGAFFGASCAFLYQSIREHGKNRKEETSALAVLFQACQINLASLLEIKGQYLEVGDIDLSELVSELKKGANGSSSDRKRIYKDWNLLYVPHLKQCVDGMMLPMLHTGWEQPLWTDYNIENISPQRAGSITNVYLRLRSSLKTVSSLFENREENCKEFYLAHPLTDLEVKNYKNDDGKITTQLLAIIKLLDIYSPLRECIDRSIALCLCTMALICRLQEKSFGKKAISNATFSLPKEGLLPEIEKYNRYFGKIEYLEIIQSFIDERFSVEASQPVKSTA